VTVFRAFVLYDEAPDEERYEQHLEFCHKVPGAVFRHGKIFGSPAGKPGFEYYAEFEFADKAAFDSALQGEEFAATGKDAMEMGRRFQVLFAEVE
jgi:hypothetical protein